MTKTTEKKLFKSIVYRTWQMIPWGQKFYVNVHLLSIWSIAASYLSQNDFLTVLGPFFSET